MTTSLDLLRDDFANNVQDPLWAASTTSGSATKSETGGQAVLTLPSSTAGSHLAAYTTSGVYDLTGTGFVWNIATMVATGVAATAYFQLLLSSDVNAQLQWRQVANSLTAHSISGGVDTTLYTVAWSAATYKYLRIRESAGTIFWDSSTNGTTWTNRASLAAPFGVTSLIVQFAAACGNVASPGSLKLDDVNLILPAPSATWRETTADWSISNRLRPITLASDGGMVGVIVTADTMDSSRNLGGTVRYFAGPLGSSSGGFLALTEYATLLLAQASAFPIPGGSRLDLPTLIDARYMRLYHRNIDASNHVLSEFVPRRIVQADDIEAESIQAINIGAGQVTADKIFVLNLAAVSAQMGALHMDGVIDIASTGGIYQGSGTFAAPTTGLKLFNSGGVGKLSGYNGGVEQATFDTDGRIKAGAGNVVLDANGIALTIAGSFIASSAVNFLTSGAAQVGSVHGIGVAGTHTMSIKAYSIAGENAIVALDSLAPTTKTGSLTVLAQSGAVQTTFAVRANDGASPTQTMTCNGTATLSAGLNVGSATGATGGEVVASGTASAFGGTRDGNVSLKVVGSDTTSSRYSIVCYNSTPTLEFSIRNDGVGFTNQASWVYSSDISKKKNIRALGRDIGDLAKLKPVKFDYIDGAADQLGFIAQDVQAVFPELIEVQFDGTLGMRTDSLIPVMLHAFKRLVKLLITKGVITAADIAGVEPEP